MLQTCQKLKIDLNFLVGQGYDGAAVMKGEFQGCATRVTQKYPQALYVHCSCHCLNLAVGASCSIHTIRNSLGTIKEVINFFRPSYKRESFLKDELENLDGITKRRLTKLCETRWTERLDAVITFKEFFVPMFFALDKIQEDARDPETAKKAFAFQQVLKSGTFIIAMVVIHEIFSYTQALATYLQSVNVDLAAAVNMADELRSVLQEMRTEAQSHFHRLFSVAEEMAQKVEGEIKKPRVARLQRNRDNYDADSAEDYFRQSIFVPFLDHFILQLEVRFLQHRVTLSKIQNILPSKVISLSEEEIERSVGVMIEQWPNATLSSANVCVKEVLLWKRQWDKNNDRPTTFIDTLNGCNELLYPNLFKFLKIGATLPVTVASVERSFSSLKRIKTYLRNSTGQGRLNGLAVMSIHIAM